MPRSFRCAYDGTITYRLSYRDLVEMMAERDIKVAHSTILRWVTRYVPEFEKRWARFSRTVGTSWRVDETYVSIKAKWHFARGSTAAPGAIG
jgi:transposase-like protein